jgi:hypothetical protein
MKRHEDNEEEAGHVKVGMEEFGVLEVASR